MTVTYTSEVATISGVGVFWKLLLRWKGSMYKLIWKDMCLYIILYYIIRCVYHYALNEPQQVVFASISKYCRSYSTLIPLAFVLGFYVQIVMTRWWNQYTTLPWPDTLAVYVTTLVHGLDERGRLMRRTIMRYVNLSFVVTMSMMSPRVKKRFPTPEHLVEAGFMTSNEQKIFDNLTESFSLALYWMPLVWAGSIVTRARKEGRIRDDFAVKTLLDTINAFRGGCGGLLGYDWMSIPLVYTQVVTLAVYMYFASTLLGSQFVIHGKDPDLDLYVPWFTLLQYLFYVGWLKVAETLVNPFGEDDDDFEVNWLIDRNIQVSYLIVDEMHNEHPDLIQDKYWDEVLPVELPYTVATECFRKPAPLGSTANLHMSKYDQLFVRHEVASDSEDESDIGLIANIKKRPSEIDGDIEMGSEPGSKGIFKEDNPDLWVSSNSVPRNESYMKLAHRQGSIKSVASSGSIAKRPFELRLRSNRRLMKQISIPDEKTLYDDRTPTPPVTSQTVPGTHLEAMEEEDLSEAQILAIKEEEGEVDPLLPIEDSHVTPIMVTEKDEDSKHEAKIEPRDTVLERKKDS